MTDALVYLKLRARWLEQMRWMDTRGMTRSGYREYYRDDFGDGPDAIYEADLQDFMEAQADLEAFMAERKEDR